jgi:hypothetical protein
METVYNTETFIDECKKLVELDERDYLQSFLREALEDGQVMDWPFIFQKVFLHACLKGRAEIAEWLEKDVFPLLDAVQQIALRQTFSYGRHLLRQAKQRQGIRS